MPGSIRLFVPSGPIPELIQIQSQAAIRTDLSHRVARTPQRGRRFPVGGAALIDRQRDASRFERYPELSGIDATSLNLMLGAAPYEDRQTIIF